MIDQNERLKNLIAHITLKNSYWGYLFSRVRRVGVKGLPSIMGVAPTVDGTLVLAFEPALLANTDDREIKIIIEHEGMHLLNKHISRSLRMLSNEVSDDMRDVKGRIWNHAADCAVNTLISMPEKVKVNGEFIHPLFPKYYKLPDRKSTEFYYNEMLKDVNFVNINIPGDGEGAEGKSGSGEGISKGSGIPKNNQLDDHSKWSQIAGQISDVSSLSRKVDAYLQNIIKDSLKSFEKKRQRGLLPGYIAELINQALTPPKVTYYQIIAKLIKGTRLSKFKRSLSRINRKRTYVFMIGENKNVPMISPFPGRTRDFSFKIDVVIDTSGSMSPEDIIKAFSK